MGVQHIPSYAMNTPSNEDLVRELHHLRVIEAEYRATQMVMAVLVEELLRATGGTVVEVGQAALRDTPDLFAWKDPETRAIMFRASR